MSHSRVEFTGADDLSDELCAIAREILAAKIQSPQELQRRLVLRLLNRVACALTIGDAAVGQVTIAGGRDIASRVLDLQE